MRTAKHMPVALMSMPVCPDASVIAPTTVTFATSATAATSLALAVIASCPHAAPSAGTVMALSAALSIPAPPWLSIPCIPNRPPKTTRTPPSHSARRTVVRGRARSLIGASLVP